MSTDSLPVIPHWIDGARRASTSGRTAPVFNPATGEVQAHVALADEAEIPAEGGVKKVPCSVFSFRTRALTCIRADHPSPRLIQAK